MSATTAPAVTVRADGVLRGDLAPVLASLPDDFTSGIDSETGEMAVVNGRRADWPALLRDALATARGVLLLEPGEPVTVRPRGACHVVQELALLADSAGVPAVVDRRWSGAPGIRAFAESFVETVTRATSVTVLLAEGDGARSIDDVVLDALGLVRAAGAVVGRLDRVHRRPGGWSAWGRTTDGAVLHIQGVHTAAGAGAVVTASSASAEASVRVPDARSAAPALARCADATGGRTLPTEFETATRASFRRLRERIAGDGTRRGGAGAELAALADDLALLRDAV